jgi:hypothetical protein
MMMASGFFHSTPPTLRSSPSVSPEAAIVKYQGTRFKNLRMALKELERFIRDGNEVQTGRPLDQFGGLRPRELIANWCLCVAFNNEHGSAERLTFTSDPHDGDGILYDTETQEAFPTEHVLVPVAPSGETIDIEALILSAINEKRKKGKAAYASGKTLVVFLNAGGGVAWKPDRMARQLPDPLYFETVWVVGLHLIEAGEYIYSVSHLDVSEGNAMTWLIHIANDFNSWRVTRIQ